MSQNADEMSMQQRAMIVTLALLERGRGSMSYPLELKVTREFWKEALCILRWQKANQDTLNQLVAWGWLSEYAAPWGTMFYSLTDVGRQQATQVIEYASSHVFDFVPQTASLFNLEEEY